MMRVAFAGAVVACLVLTAPARADVFEIGPAGPAWVSGGPAGTPASAVVVGNPVDAGTLPNTIPPRFRSHVAHLSAKYDLSPALIEALVWQESRWNTAAVSPVGATGLAQLMPGTARQLRVNPQDPDENLEGGARYLRMQLNTFNGDLEKALAAYNAGPGRVLSAGGVPRIRETQNYVTGILGRLSKPARR